MCIIAISKTGAKPLDKAVLDICFANNPDGAGFAWWDGEVEEWFVEKGFMTFDEFWEGYSSHNFQHDDYVVCHFRVGTSGLKDAGNTHPFPICDNVETMRQTKFHSPSIAIHNGVIGKGEAVASDTMVHVRDYLYPLYKFIHQEEKLVQIMADVSDLKYCRWFITDKEDIYQWGKWHEDKESGWEFSNENYKAKKSSVIYSTYKSPYNFNNNGGTTYTPNPQPGSSPKTKTPSSKKYSGYFRPDGTFDSQTWRNDIAKRLEMLDSKDDEVDVTENENEEDFVYGILSDDGEAIWDRMTEDEKTGVGSTYLFCPRCWEDKRLMESPYLNMGDTLCQNCGAIFEDASGEIIGEDPDYKRIYKATNRK